MHYQRIPALQEYVLVSQAVPRIEVFRRLPDGTWQYRDATAQTQYRDATAQTLEVCGTAIDLSALYANLPD
jgi:Uma2 family endonuclease